MEHKANRELKSGLGSIWAIDQDEWYTGLQWVVQVTPPPPSGVSGEPIKEFHHLPSEALTCLFITTVNNASATWSQNEHISSDVSQKKHSNEISVL